MYKCTHVWTADSFTGECAADGAFKYGADKAAEPPTCTPAGYPFWIQKWISPAHQKTKEIRVAWQLSWLVVEALQHAIESRVKMRITI